MHLVCCRGLAGCRAPEARGAGGAKSGTHSVQQQQAASSSWRACSSRCSCAASGGAAAASSAACQRTGCADLVCGGAAAAHRGGTPAVLSPAQGMQPSMYGSCCWGAGVDCAHEVSGWARACMHGALSHLCVCMHAVSPPPPNGVLPRECVRARDMSESPQPVCPVSGMCVFA